MSVRRSLAGTLPWRSAATVLLAVLTAPAALARADNGPNIVILFADDLGYADLQSYGNPYIRTPALDRMADEGQRWTDFYASSPVCSPSRGGLLTGQLSVRSGLYGSKLHVMFPDDEHGISVEHFTVAAALRAAGYHTGIFGKWHLGDAPHAFPTRHGFDYWYGIPYSNDMNPVGAPHYDVVLPYLAGDRTGGGEAEEVGASFRRQLERFENPRSEYWDVPLYRSEALGGVHLDELVEQPLEQPTFTRRITEEAVRFIREHHDRPFLVYVPYAMPHLPLFRSEAFAGTSLRGEYGDVIEEMDWSVGRIRQTLEELGIAEDTLVVFTSDNGPWQAVSTVGAGSAGMLRGSKGSVWEGGVRVPGIFWWPGKVEPGVVSDIGTTLDLFATALSLAGIAAPADIDGLDLTGTLLGASAGPRTELPYYHKGHLKAYRKGRYKMVFFGGDDTATELPRPQLYDLHRDLSERQDLFEQRPDVVDELLQAVAAHHRQVTVAEPIFDRRLRKE